MDVADPQGRARFIKGTLLAWVPLLFLLIPVFLTAFRGISSQKATGLGAVAGAFTEGFLVFGFAVAVGSEIAAIALLSRTLSRSYVLRTTSALVSICASLVMLAMLGALLWFVRSIPH